MRWSPRDALIVLDPLLNFQSVTAVMTSSSKPARKTSKSKSKASKSKAKEAAAKASNELSLEAPTFQNKVIDKKALKQLVAWA